MPTKKSSETTFLTPGDLAPKAEKVNVEKEADKIVQKLNSDRGLLDAFKGNGLSVIQNLLPAVKDKGILQSILDAVLSKLNLGNLLGGLGGLFSGKEEEKEEAKEEKPKTSSKKKKKTSSSGKTGSSSGKKTDSTSGKKKTSSSGKKKTSSSGKKTDKKEDKKEEKKEEGGLLSGFMNLLSGK